jgi:Flp pilus assembly protein CpaB
MPPRAPLTTPDWQAAVRRRTQFYLLVAFLLAVLFGVLVFQFFTQQRGTEPGVLTMAVFANEDIPIGTTITADMLVVRNVSGNAVPPLYYTFTEQVVGRVALYPLVAGEVILPGKLMGDQGGPMAQRCPDGYWCLSIPTKWFVAAPPNLAQGDSLEIAAVQPGNPLGDAGYIATQVLVVALPQGSDDDAYVLAVDDQEALSILYAHANEFQLLVLLRPAGG